MAEKNWGDLFKNAALLSIDFAEKGISTLRRIPPLAKEVAQQPTRKKTQGQKTRTQRRKR